LLVVERTAEHQANDQASTLMKELVRDTYRLISVEKVIRYFQMTGRFHETPQDVMKRIAKLLDAYRESLKTTAAVYEATEAATTDFAGNLEHGERQHGDDLLLLAVHYLLDIYLADKTSMSYKLRCSQAHY
jgi:hypothetical protein